MPPSGLLVEMICGQVLCTPVHWRRAEISACSNLPGGVPVGCNFISSNIAGNICCGLSIGITDIGLAFTLVTTSAISVTRSSCINFVAPSW